MLRLGDAYPISPGQGCVDGLRFGAAPEDGPAIIRVLRQGKDDGAIKFDLNRYVSEVLEGVADANEKHGGDLTVEAIQVTPDDYPTPGQAKYVAYLIARNAITGEGYPSSPEPGPRES